MLFAEKIKQLRDERQLPQRKLAAELQIDTATYCKIERGDRKAKREHVVLLSDFFKIVDDELITLWLADQIIDVVKEEKELARKTLKVVQQYVRR